MLSTTMEKLRVIYEEGQQKHDTPADSLRENSKGIKAGSEGNRQRLRPQFKRIYPLTFNTKRKGTHNRELGKLKVIESSPIGNS